MTIITNRTTKSTKIGPGKTLVQRTTNGGKTSSSFKTKTKSGTNSWITQTCGPLGNTITHSTNIGGTTYSTTDRTDSKKPTTFAHKSPKNPKSSRSSFRSRSSDDNGDAITALCAGFIVAIFAVIGWLFSWMFGSSKESESE